MSLAAARATLIIAMVIASVIVAGAVPPSLTLANPANGDILTIDAAYTIRWTSPVADTLMLVALLRCATTLTPTVGCKEVTRWSGPNSGSITVTPAMSLGINDGYFYRFQILTDPTLALGTSGTFTFVPVPVPVDTRFEFAPRNCRFAARCPQAHLSAASRVHTCSLYLL